MKLTRVLLKRKPAAQLKPQSFVRNWQWHNSWQIQRERQIRNFGLKEALLERGVAVENAEDFLSPIIPNENVEPLDLVETIQKKLPKDENHPLWQERPAYSCIKSTFQPKGQQLDFALALTNSVGVDRLPDRVLETKEKLDPVSSSLSESIERIIKTSFAGDATQVLLPKSRAVPFIGWHPVESKMRPRNQYDWKAMSWGRIPPRSYGIPTQRRNHNLITQLYKEIRKNSGPGEQDWSKSYSEHDMHRQFIESSDGKLIRFFVPVAFSVLSSAPQKPYADAKSVADTTTKSVPDVSPQLPVAGLWPTNVYRPESNHPISSLEHSHPYVHTIVDHDNNYNRIGYPNWIPDAARGKGLLRTFAVALGQARLRFGSDVEGVLPQPVCINTVTTNGLQFQLSAFQLNTMDLGDDTKNIFWYHDETLSLLESCGYEEARINLRGYDPQVYDYLKALYMQGQDKMLDLNALKEKSRKLRKGLN